MASASVQSKLLKATKKVFDASAAFIAAADIAKEVGAGELAQRLTRHSDESEGVANALMKAVSAAGRPAPKESKK